MANVKKYISLDKLDLFHSKSVEEMLANNTTVLSSAKKYTDDELASFSTEMNEALDSLVTEIGNVANKEHTHTISQVNGLQAELNAKEIKGSADSALASAKSYTNEEIETALNLAKNYTDNEIISAISSLGVSKTLLEILPLQTATVEGQTEFYIDYETFDASTDKILVQNGARLLYPNVDFTAYGNKVTLVEGVPLGRTIGMYLFKDVVVPYSDYAVSGSTIVDGTITKDKLSSDIQNEINGLRATVDELKAYLDID
jgi:hypothetical protein